MATKKKTVWRESASLIVAARSTESDDNYDYKLLLLERSEKTAFAPNQCVFPGGIFESADESIEWMKYFEEFGVSQQALRQLLIVGEEQRPRILAPRGTGCYDRFFYKTSLWAREISLRITAIRETFEEAGILLCRKRQQLQHLEKANYGCVVTEFDQIRWQRRVHNDAKEFLRLCRELDVIPDLWGLYEWSAWASPAPISKGFETVFFITLLPALPKLSIEASEVKDYLWRSPANFLQLYFNDELWFLPPQIYELLRFRGVKSFDALLSFAHARSIKGTTLYMPVAYLCTDGLVSVLPGDDYYVDDPRSVEEFIPVDLTMEEFRVKAKHVHRCENVGMPKMRVYLNFNPPNGHLPPLETVYARNKL